MKYIYTYKNNYPQTLFCNGLNSPSNPFPSVFYCFPLYIQMTTVVFIYKAWTSVLDGLFSTHTFLAVKATFLIVSLIPISTVYFIQNLSLISSLKSLDQIWGGGGCTQLSK